MAEKYLHEYQVFDAESDMLKWLYIITGNAKAFVSSTFHGPGRKYVQKATWMNTAIGLTEDMKIYGREYFQQIVSCGNTFLNIAIC